MNYQEYYHSVANSSATHHRVFEDKQHHQQVFDVEASTSFLEQGQAIAITDPTPLDVLCGRGQGVLRHTGNIMYRKLVFVNKVLYAKCPKCDKIKISRGIVAAVREVGGRFLEHNERTQTYSDVGDKRAAEKTSQALREGQTKIRQQMLQEGSMPANGDKREISEDGYFGYSVQVLKSFINEEKNRDLDISAVPLPQQAPPSPSAEAAQRKLAAAEGLVAIRIPAGFGGANPSAITANAVTERVPCTDVVETDTAPPAKELDRSGRANAAAMARAMDQFPGADNEVPPPLPQSSIRRFSAGAGGHLSLGRLTSMSLVSAFSVESAGKVLGTFRAEEAEKGDSIGSFESVASEIQDLMRMSGPRLTEVIGMAEEGPDEGGADHVDREVAVFDEGEADEDRVSDLRFTDRGTVIGNSGGGPAARSTDFTSYSKFSLMDASVMTIAMEDMSIHDGEARNRDAQGPTPAA